jgi:diadenosine tetraphosphate (Ap4A) HIT family hydrolase
MTSSPSEPPPLGCPECAAQRELAGQPGGFVIETPTLVAHPVLGGAPLAGWMVVAPRRHVERLEDLEPEVAGELFALATRIGAAQRATLAAEKVYVALFAEVVPHLHVHVIPRPADAPPELRGPRCFLASPAQHLPAERLHAVAARLKVYLSTAAAAAQPTKEDP